MYRRTRHLVGGLGDHISSERSLDGSGKGRGSLGGRESSNKEGCEESSPLWDKDRLIAMHKTILKSRWIVVIVRA